MLRHTLNLLKLLGGGFLLLAVLAFAKPAISVSTCCYYEDMEVIARYGVNFPRYCCGTLEWAWNVRTDFCIDYECELIPSCPELEAPCAGDGAIYQNSEYNPITREAAQFWRLPDQGEEYCDTGPVYTWAPITDAICTWEECGIKCVGPHCCPK